MASRTPTQDSLKLQIAKLRSGKRLKDIAEAVGHDKATVSKAIRHGRYPRVVEKVKAFFAL